MKFGRRFELSKIPEWANFYVSYRTLKKLLSPYKLIGKYHLQCNLENGKIAIQNFGNEELEKLQHFTQAFEQVALNDLQKIFLFYNLELSHTIVKWRKLRINMALSKQKKESLNQDVREEYMGMLKESFQILIKELQLFNNYISINLEAFHKILKKQVKVTSPIFPECNMRIKFERYLIDTKAFTMRDRVNNFLYSIENEYMDFFYKNRSEGVMELRKIFQGTLISRNELFWFGLYFGFTALLILIMIILAYDGNLDVDEDELFKKIFPIFRGMAVIILYIWLLAWNVYGWTSYNVNYKLIFRFSHHYSQLSQILKRAAGFSTAFIILLLWYMILAGHKGKFATIIGFIPQEIIPLFIWLIFLIYMMFPYFKVLNGPGRKYTFRLIKNIFKTPFIPVTFTIVWATDQMTSFVLPLKDLEYTICFYIAYFFSDENAVQECQSSKRFTKGLIMATIPLIIRCLQCLRQVYDGKPNRRDPALNFGKYMCSVIVAILSYLVAIYDSAKAVVICWIISAAISTVYSYYWDLKKDWGFLVPKSKHKFLRNQLSYNKPLFYYIAVLINLVMRLAWILSISPAVLAKIMRPELFALIVGFVEILRRSVWNFLRVEKEHIANVGSFKVVPEMRLPFEDIKCQTDAEDELFNQDLKAIMEREDIIDKPISMSGSSQYGYTLIKNRSKSEGKEQKVDLDSLFDGVERLKLQQLSEMTLNPLSLTREKEIEDLNKDLLRVKREKCQLDVWSKEIKKFKQDLSKRANKYEVLTIQKDSKKVSLPNQLENSKQTNESNLSPSNRSQSKISTQKETKQENNNLNEHAYNLFKIISDKENEDPNVKISINFENCNSPENMLQNSKKSKNPFVFGEETNKFHSKYNFKSPKISKNQRLFLSEPNNHREDSNISKSNNLSIIDESFQRKAV